jgi:hypothetical protein
MYCDIKTKVAEISSKILNERISEKFAEHSVPEKFFLDFMIENHGAKFIKENFKDNGGTVYKIGRLVNFVDDVSELSLPLVEDWENGSDDLRLRYSIYNLESIANIGDGMGDDFLPVGILYTGEYHPDDEVVQHSDMLALDMTSPGIPKAVVWHNDKSVKEYYQAQKKGIAMDPNKFTVQIAENFEKFIEILY